jgi:5,10-methylenetetrahydromethanopterin reductase
MTGLQVWCASAGIPGYTVRVAQRAEAEGWDGLGLVDSQNLAGDPFIELALSATVTSRLLLATAVTNPFTRHPAAAATAIATVHAESRGRAVFGVGRGDSALAHLGLSPAPVARFEQYMRQLQGYLAGEEVPFTVAADTVAADEMHSSDDLAMAGGPSASRLRWIVGSPLAKVPVDVAASGPKVIALAARLAERVTFAVGADVDRVAWAIDVARRARADAGLSPDGLGLGVYVPVLVHPDRAVARIHISGGLASYARFSVMHGTVNGPADAPSRDVLTAVHDAYDMEHHFRHGSPQSTVLTDDVIDQFGIAGPPEYCIERLSQLVALGLDKLFILGGGIDLDRDAARASHTAFVEEVLPVLRDRAAP